MKILRTIAFGLLTINLFCTLALAEDANAAHKKGSHKLWIWSPVDNLGTCRI